MACLKKIPRAVPHLCCLACATVGHSDLYGSVQAAAHVTDRDVPILYLHPLAHGPVIVLVIPIKS